MKDNTINLLSVFIFPTALLMSIIFRNQFDGSILFLSLGCFIIVAGSVLWVKGILTLGRNFTPSLSPKGFETKGIYSIMRHPMYIGGFLFYLGMNLLTQSIIGMILSFLLVAPLLIYSALEEEKQMIAKYGNKYLEYKRNTRL